jgi:hypothetical protein
MVEEPQWPGGVPGRVPRGRGSAPGDIARARRRGDDGRIGPRDYGGAWVDRKSGEVVLDVASENGREMVAAVADGATVVSDDLPPSADAPKVMSRKSVPHLSDVRTGLETNDVRIRTVAFLSSSCVRCRTRSPSWTRLGLWPVTFG